MEKREGYLANEKYYPRTEENISQMTPTFGQSQCICARRVGEQSKKRLHQTLPHKVNLNIGIPVPELIFHH